MALWSRLSAHCPICKSEYDWMRGYGARDMIRCCCKVCYKEFEWRYTLAVMGKEYHQQPIVVEKVV